MTSTKQIIKKINISENHLALSLSKIHSIKKSEKYLSKVEFDMEWFLTWALKLLKSSSITWCDGFESFYFTDIRNNKFKFEANMWTGPNAAIQYTRRLNGYIILNKNLKNFSTYCFCIYDENRTYRLTDKLINRYQK